MPCSEADEKRFQDGLDCYPQKWTCCRDFDAVLREEKEKWQAERAAEQQAESKRWLKEKEEEENILRANGRIAQNLSEDKWSKEERKGWTLDLEPFSAPKRHRSRSRGSGRDALTSSLGELQLEDDEFSEWSIEANPRNCNCESECAPRGRRGAPTTSFKPIREWSEASCRRGALTTVFEHMKLGL